MQTKDFFFLLSFLLAQIGPNIGLTLTGSSSAERDTFLLIPDLTLGRTTNKYFPQGAPRCIIHTDLPWLMFSWVFYPVGDAESLHLTSAFIFKTAAN